MADPNMADLRRLVAAAVDEARQSHAPNVEAEHLLLALSSRPSSPAGRVLAEHGLGYDAIQRALLEEQHSSLRAAGVEPVPRARLISTPAAAAKNDANSGISPSFFHVLPLREIIESRVTRPATIHCCSVPNSRQVLLSPFSRRIIHTRSAVPATGGVDTLVVGRRRILNMCPQLVHLTVTPVGLRRASSSSYSVPHFSQRTSIGAIDGRTTRWSACHFSPWRPAGSRDGTAVLSESACPWAQELA